MEEKSPSLTDVLVPAVVLIGMILLIVSAFGVDAGGVNQVALISAAAVTCMIGVKNGISWEEMEKGMFQTIMLGLKAILILIVVGGLIGSWILSGTVPAMVYFGMKLLSPAWFYPACCLICALVALSVGSSWTVAGTVGLGLMGVATVVGLSPEITAGAIISGAYFGDKMSPLSDTTNLAAAVTSTDLFHHIRNMTWTTLPSLFLALAVFSVVSFKLDPGSLPANMTASSEVLAANFDLGIYVFVPLLVVLAMALRRHPVLPTLAAGLVAGVITALLFQYRGVVALGGGSESVMAPFKGVVIALLNGYQSATGDASIDSLLSKGGMSSMLGTVFLIICALSFGGAYERAGLLNKMMSLILSKVHTAGGLVTATLGTCMSVNVLSADQYISVVVPGRMYHDEYTRRGLHGLNLSRAIEDSGTLTSALVPWNTCGVFMAATLGVATIEYAPWAVLNWACPVISALFAWIGFRVLPLSEK